MQRKAGSSTEPREIPPIVHEVLRSPGQPLDAETRAFLEPRLGQVLGESRATPHSLNYQKLALSQPGDFHELEADEIAERVLSSPESVMPHGLARDQAPRYDLSRIRIHADQRAAESAQTVNALAFTVGHNVVFGAGSYLPRSSFGRRLLAHELAHTAQQGLGLARQQKSAAAPCLSSDVCKDVKPPSKLLKEGKEEGKDRREQREKLCTKKPPDPGCTADGHAGRAVQLEKLLRSYDPARLTTNEGIFVDKDLESGFGAMTLSCADFTPPLASKGHCITVPFDLEQQAALFNSTTGPGQKIDGKERGLWREQTLEMLVHEAEHTRFRTLMSPTSKLVPGGVPVLLGKRRPSCPKDEDGQRNVHSSLNELGAMLQEFPMQIERIKTSVGLSAEDKRKELEGWRNHRIRGKEQSITVSLRNVRCRCGCGDAEDLIRQTIDFATSSWTLQEKRELDRELTDAQWDTLDLRWPAIVPQKGDFPLRILPEGTEAA
ncbi:MAG TPA: DUF4157 domain-containing protein [Candidatus Binatia bacterium]